MHLFYVQKLSHNFFKWYPSLPFLCIHPYFDVRIEHQLGPSLASDNWTNLQKYLKQSPSLCKAFITCFSELNFFCSGFRLLLTKDHEENFYISTHHIKNFVTFLPMDWTSNICLNYGCLHNNMILILFDKICNIALFFNFKVTTNTKTTKSFYDHDQSYLNMNKKHLRYVL